jgi:hypothetical protein
VTTRGARCAEEEGRRRWLRVGREGMAERPRGLLGMEGVTPKCFAGAAFVC